LFELALDVRTRALGPSHYLTGVTLHSFAVASAQSGDMASAADRFSRAADVFRASLGPSDLMLQDALEGLAIVRAMQGRVSGAFDALDEAVAAGYRREARLQQPPFDRLSSNPRMMQVRSAMHRPRVGGGD
jgi:hypothetical protein